MDIFPFSEYLAVLHTRLFPQIITQIEKEAQMTNLVLLEPYSDDVLHHDGLDQDATGSDSDVSATFGSLFAKFQPEDQRSSSIFLRRLSLHPLARGYEV